MVALAFETLLAIDRGIPRGCHPWMLSSKINGVGVYQRLPQTLIQSISRL
jgi:hypothetical protein